MATVTTSTATNPIQYGGSTRLDVYPSDKSLWVMSLNNSGNIELSRSTNNGSSWAVANTLSRANIQETTMYIPSRGSRIHVVYRTNESSQDRVYHRMYDIDGNSWNSEILVASASNGGTPASILTGLDVVVAPATGYYVAIAVGIQGGGTFGMVLYGVYVNTNNSASLAPGMFAGPTSFRHSGSGRVGPQLDLEHIGDGKRSNTPHLWATFGRTRINMMSCGWTGWGWTTPSAAYNMVDPVPAQNWIRGMFDGRRYVAASANNANTSTVAVWERNRSGTGATKGRTTPTHPAGVVKTCSLAYDYSQDDLRVFAVGTSNNDLYFTTYDRSANSWSAWSVVTATDVLGSPPENYSIKRNTYHNARFDALIAHSGSPNTVVHWPVVQAYTPGAPTWASPANGSAQDVSAALPLDWTFNDVDPGDAQTAYAVRRQIGAGAFAYWRASDSTWQVAEVKNSSGTTALTLASSWGSGADANHSYAVKVWDVTDLPSAYSSALSIVPSVKVNPTITSPTAAQVIAGDRITVTWTVSEQTAYRVRLLDTTNGSLVVHDSGFIASLLTTSYDIPYTMRDANAWSVRVTTKNNEGLESTEVAIAFTTDFVEPAVPSLAYTPIPASGVIRVAITNPSPVGSEPALLSQDLYRREESPPLNVNPYATVDRSGWTPTNATPAVRSTAQFHEGVASFALTGTGALATIDLLHDTFIPVESGAAYSAGVWLYSASSWTDASLGVLWFDAAFASIPQAQTGIAIPAARWTYCGKLFTPPAGAVWAKPRMRAGSTVPNGQVIYFDEVRFERDEPGTPTIRVAADLPSNATVDDWRAVSGQSYEYRVLARGVNGTTYRGPWTV